MAVRPRASADAVDLGDQKALVERGVEWNVELYNRTKATMYEAFTEPLSKQEIEDILARLDAARFAAMVAVNPKLARELLKAAREGED